MDDPNKPATPPDAQLADALRLQLPLLYTQANGLIASANSPLLELLGYGPDEVLGHHCSMLLASTEEMAGSACLLGDLARKKSATSRCARPMATASGWT